jgi:IMP dehydrogenase
LRERIIGEALTFDDVLLVPAESDVLPSETSLKTRFTRRLALNVPIVSSAMDTVTDANLAIALAREGGIGVVHRNMAIAEQAAEVDKVKRSESGMITKPITLKPGASVGEALDLMARFRISGVPITDDGGKLVGILTNRDLCFLDRTDVPVSKVMTSKHLVTVPEGTTLDEAKVVLHEHRIEKVPVVDDEYCLRGLITVKDIKKRLQYPDACKDDKGRLRVAAAVGVSKETMDRAAALIEAGADALLVDSAHGHSKGVIAMVEKIKGRWPGQDLVAGNVVTADGAEALIAAGADAVKVGVGPGSICTTRVIGGGRPAGDRHHAVPGSLRRQGSAARRGRRDQVLRRHRKGHRRGCALRDDREPVRRDGGESRGARSLRGQELQGLPGDGIAGGHEARLAGSLFPGRGRAAQAGAGGH